MIMQRHRGFSLLEMMVAITIIGVGFTALFSSISTGLRNIERVGEYESKLELARTKLAELELVQSIKPGDIASGAFDDGTRWHVEVFAFLPHSVNPEANAADILVRFVVTLEWQGRSAVQNLSVDTYKRMIQLPSSPSLGEQLNALR